MTKQEKQAIAERINEAIACCMDQAEELKAIKRIVVSSETQDLPLETQ